MVEAVGGPQRPDLGFDGPLGLFVVGREAMAKRNSKFREKGEVYMKQENMDGELFREIVTEKIFPAIKKKLKRAKSVRLIFDRGGGHDITTSLPALNKIGAKMKPRVIVECQPANSPDCNIWDLGLLNSMKSRLPIVRYVSDAEKTIEDRIVDEVMKVWDMFPSDKFHAIFETLKMVHRSIIQFKGGNEFMMPHKRDNEDS